MIPNFSNFMQGSDQAADANPEVDPTDVEGNETPPALFATIHHKSEHRPDGYSPEDIEELNHLANGGKPSKEDDDKDKPQG